MMFLLAQPALWRGLYRTDWTLVLTLALLALPSAALVTYLMTVLLQLP